MSKNSAQALVYVPTYSPEAMAASGRYVAGVPPLVRSLMNLQLAGIEHITLLVAEDQKTQLERFLERYPDRKLPEYNLVTYEEPYRVGEKVLQELQNLMAPEFLLLDTNLLFNPPLAKNMLSAPIANHELLELVDGTVQLPCYVANKSILESLQEFVRQEAHSIESCIRFIREKYERRSFHNSTAYSTFLIKRINDIEVAEKFLCENIRLSAHGFVAKHLNKRISLPLSLFFSRIWLKPNIITTFNLIIGILSGVFVANGENHAAMIFGAFLFQAASVLDGCDGEVAKLTFRFSKYGGLFDTVVDYIGLFSFIVGLIVGLWNATHSWLSFIISGNLLFCVSALLAIVVIIVRKNSGSSTLVAFEQDFVAKLPSTYPSWAFWMLHKGKFFIKKDFFSLAALVLALFNKTFWWLYAANVLTIITLALIVYLVYRESQQSRATVALANSEEAQNIL